MIMSQKLILRKYSKEIIDYLIAQRDRTIIKKDLKEDLKINAKALTSVLTDLQHKEILAVGKTFADTRFRQVKLLMGIQEIQELYDFNQTITDKW